ncbi:hypothetical protein RUM43_013012 [Polyplax serrata]|uniref:Uncharacterized protein n=1 Tax=Polyplax serrata TaxID=468196 RepID=A0AAN8RSJ0_POLSC
MDETSSSDQRANTRPPRISMSRRLVKPNSCRAEYYKLEKARVPALRVKIQSTSNLHADPSTEKLGLQRENIQPISRDDNLQHEDMIQQDVRRVAKLNKSSTSTRRDLQLLPRTLNDSQKGGQLGMIFNLKVARRVSDISWRHKENKTRKNKNNTIKY